jgi:hypothetical protein
VINQRDSRRAIISLNHEFTSHVKLWPGARSCFNTGARRPYFSV